MIFITLGSQKFQFNRLLEKVDKLVLENHITEPVFAQSGVSDYNPKSFNYKTYLDRNEFASKLILSDIVITHGGTGAIVTAVKMGKKVIAVPRLSKFNEHVDDHQVQILQQFHDMDLIYACFDCERLGEAIEITKKKNFQKYQSNTDNIIKSIEDYLSLI